MKAKTFLLPAVACLAWLLAAAVAAADSNPPGRKHEGRGIVEAIDPVKATVTLEHEPIASLRWPRMVMDFKVDDPAQLADLREGDAVVFELTTAGKEYTITRISPAP